MAAQNTLLAQKEAEYMKSLRDFLELEFKSGARGKLDYLRVEAQFLQAQSKVLSASRDKKYLFKKLAHLAGFKSDKNDLKPINRLIEILKDPYTQKDDILDYQTQYYSNKKYQTFCGT